MRKKALLILTLMLLVGAMGARAAEAYAYYEYEDKSLNFRYDNNKSNYSKSSNYIVYSLNTGTNTPAWHSMASSIELVYFNSSFASYKPTTCYQWFYEMKNLKYVYGIQANLNTSNVTNMDLMFCWCYNLTSVDVSGFKTSNVTTMQAMFEDDYNLTTLAVDNWDTSKVKNMSGMFYGCSKLTSLNVKDWNTSSVTSMRYLFFKCTSLKSLDVRNWRTTLVTSFYYMFGYDSNLETIGGLTSLYTGTQNFVMNSNVSTVDGMFYNCSKLYQLWLGNFNFGSSTSSAKMLQNCTALKHLEISKSMANYLNSEACSGVGTTSSPCYMNYYNDTHPSFTTITPDYVVWKSGYFKNQSFKAYAQYNNSTLTFYYDDYSSSRPGTVYDLNTGRNAPGWHSSASSVTSVVFNSTFANARPTSCYEWFDGMTNLTGISNMSSYLNTSQVTNMDYMFYNCSKLANIYLSGFNTANVTSMLYMFYNCSNLASLDVSGFNTAKVTDMRGMFSSCTKLTDLSISNFNLSSLTASTNMFYGCAGLKNLTIPSTASKLDDTACSGVGATASPCRLWYPANFAPTKTRTGEGWYMWKGGYFLDYRAYANLSSDKKTLTFYYDLYWPTRSGTVYSLNTGTNAPGWRSYASSVTSVTFNYTFADFLLTTCYKWFDGMSNLATINNIGNLNTTKVTNMSYMFCDCSKLSSLNLKTTLFKTENVTDMSNMFDNCYRLTSIDVSNFNTAKVTNMNYMFRNCLALTGLNISNFNMSNLSSSSAMMAQCTRLKTLTIPSTANKLSFDACAGVGTQSSPCNLSYPSGFTPTQEATGDGWYKWKNGYFTDSNTKSAYAFLSSDKKTLTFYYDGSRYTRTGGTVYSLNTGYATPGWNSNASTVTSVVFNSSFSGARPTSCCDWFMDMENLTSISGLTYLNTSSVTNMSAMFYNCKKLTSIDLSNFNTSNVTDMSSMFFYCSSLTSLNVSSFNTAKVTSMGVDPEEGPGGMFEGCTNLKSLDVSKFNTANVLNMGNMFAECTSLTSLNLSNFNTAKVKTMGGMFYNCSKLTSLNVSSFNTSNVISMAGMFNRCSSLTSINVSNFNTENVEYMDYMFYDCSKLASLDLSKFIFGHTFEDGYVVRKVIPHCDGLLAGCSSLKKLTIPGNVVVDQDAILDPEGEMIDYDLYLDLNELGDFCSGVGTEANPCELIYPDDFAPWNPVLGDGWFKWKGGCFLTAGLKAYAQLYGSSLEFYYDEYSNLHYGTTYDLNTGTNAPAWNAKASDVTTVKFDESFEDASPTSCYRWFYNMTNLTEVRGVEHLDASSVTNMASMFQGCSSLTKLTLCYEDDWQTEEDESEKSIDTRNVTTMASMFQGCSKLTSLYLGSFNTAKVTNMSSMFSGCTSLKYLDLYSEELMSPSGERSFETNFVTTKVTNMKEMFKNCKALTSLPFPGLALTSKTTTTSMFSGCSALEEFYVANNLSAAPASTFAGIGTAAKPCSLESVVLPSDAEYAPTYMLWKGGYFVDAIRTAYAVFDTNTLTFCYSNPEGAQIIAPSDTYGYYYIDNSATTPAWSANATKITKVVFTDDFKCVRPTTCQKWFNGMTKLATITGIENLNTSYVTNMAYMFQNCKKLKTLDISGFTLSSSTTTTSMMKTCSALTSLSIPATANYINASACSGVGTQSAPCTLVYPSGFTPQKTSTGSGWYMWKGGYFKDSASGKKGDANGDGEVSLLDVMLTVDYYLGKNPAGFILANAEMDGDNEISLADLLAIVDIILTQQSASIPATARESALDAVALTVKGNSCTLHLDNSEPCRGISFTVTLPEGGTMGNVSVPASRADGHHALFNAVAPGRYNVVVYANSGNPLRDGTTAMLRFDISGCQAEDITISDIQMVNNWNETVLLPATYGITTGIAGIEESDSDDSQPWYNTVGVGSSKPTRGVNIHNGKKTVVK